MKTNLILIMVVASMLGSCKKSNTEPQPVVQKESSPTIDTTWRMKSQIHYSNTATTSLSQADILIQSVDTTYYEIYKNGKLELSWKMNATYTSTPAYNNIVNMRAVLPYNKGDVFLWKILHRSPRNITSYSFNGGVTLIRGNELVRWFSGQFYGYYVEPNTPDYKVGYNSFVQVWQGEAI